MEAKLKQITIRQLVRQASQLQEWLPCEVVKDGEVIALLLPPNVAHDVRQPIERATKSDKLTELPLSKHRQAEGMTAQLANYVPY